MKARRSISLRPFVAALLAAWTVWTSGTDYPATADTLEADTVSIGNAVTEIVFALDQGHRLLARDSTSNHPPAALDLPDIGYTRALSAEGVLSVEPSLILATEGAGPPEVIELLKSTGLAFVEIPESHTGEAVLEKIRIVGEALGVPEKAEALAARVHSDLAAAETATRHEGSPKRVMFLMSAQGGKLIAAGRNTAADAVIEMAGGVNAVTGYEGYKTLEDEAAAAAAPDVVLMMDRTGEHDASAADLFALPSLATTPAAKTGALIKMDGPKILGFGPRVGEAVREINAALYGE